MLSRNEATTANLSELREQIPAVKKWAYLDNAAIGPMSSPARDVLSGWADDSANNGDIVWGGWSERVESARQSAARMVGAELEEIALVNNTTNGINIVAEGFPWKDGDNVVTLDNEFPANIYPWTNQADRGVQTRMVPVEDGRPSLERIVEACDARTRVVSVSWVSYSSGWRHDLDRLAEVVHSQGALLFVDVIQGLGVFELDVKKTPIDFACADSHKWMLGPEGAGVFFIRREHLDKLRPCAIGWRSVERPSEFTDLGQPLRKMASRYEGGTQCMGALAAMGASIDLLQSFGTAAISQRVIELSDYACERLSSIGAEIKTPRDVFGSDASSQYDTNKSGIVVFQFPDQDTEALKQRCIEQGVAVSCRAGNLRASMHAYNNEQDIERLIEVLKRGVISYQ
ncbi:MAG: aminotransferase class V-fold PLP-dependent enzyme [Pirellulales bacterium]|nr:aminotransferase class V-fold PLP-dependent enzyme [Pirellulales bacterium]